MYHPVRDVDNGGAVRVFGAGGYTGKLYTSPQFCCEPKTALNNKIYFKKRRTSLVAQWIRLRTPSSGGLGSIPGQGIRSHKHAATKSLHATTKELASCN